MNIALLYGPSIDLQIDLPRSPILLSEEYTKTFDPNFLKNQLDNTPLGRFAMGEDVANAVVAVATTLTFSTGNIITIDGGRLLK